MGVFEKALITGNDILNYIPQRPPVVMVDAFYGIDGETSYTGFTVPEESVFCRDGVLDECALIENMAQSAALRVGWLCAEAGEAVPLGFIGSVGKCDIARRVSAGERLHTTIRVAAEFENVTLAEAEVSIDGETICSCTLKIFLQR
jgi:predicted hotdog family 3-hydroxylacyl-ACP dehydratase